ncbi:MAG TPA: S53 family peptidase, partial [Pirellulales bacterium]|nr:S53 family peptidase [Pirellulales bacterium]
MKLHLARALGLFSSAFTKGKKGPRRRSTTLLLLRQTRRTVEALEDRSLLSGVHSTLVLMSPQNQSTPVGLTTPSQIQQAYGFNLINFSNGAAGTGNGQTIAIVDAFDNPRFLNSTDPNFANSDLHLFDQAFGLADPVFTIVGQTGGLRPTAIDPTGGWEMETALDVEWAHALAPQAKILLVEANTSDFSDLSTAVNTAKGTSGVSVVSMSWGSQESATEASNDSVFSATGVTFVAASGDSGTALYPAVSPNVVAVGGTNLFLAPIPGTSTSAVVQETGWHGSGGGQSIFETQPTYQRGVGGRAGTQRTAPDVAFDAGQGVAVYDSYNGGSLPWYSLGGTSLSAPSWGAIIAISNQGRALAGVGALNSSPTIQTLPLIYSLPANDFNDITTGNNGSLAGPGYDLVTGLGSPKAAFIVADLSGNQPASTQVFSDNFQRADSSNLGSNWATTAGSVGINSNHALVSSSASISGAVYVSAALTDVDISAGVNLSSTNNSVAGLVARYSGPGDSNMYTGLINWYGGQMSADIYRNIAGNFTPLVINPISLTPGTANLEFWVQGSVLQFFVNGVLDASAVDTQITAPGSVGLRANNSTTYASFSALAPAPLPISENFQRPDSSNLGSNWATTAGSVGISSNHAQVSSSASISDAVSASAALTDVDISASVNLSSTNNSVAGLVARYSGPGDSNMYTGLINWYGGQMSAEIYRNIAGNFTPLVINPI